MKPLKFCCNGDGNPIHPPSKVLCKECFKKLDEQFQKLKRRIEAFENKPTTQGTI